MEEGCSGSQCGQRKTLTIPLGIPRPPLGCREGVLGTKLGLNRMKRQPLFREVGEFSNCRTRLQGRLGRGQEEGVRREKTQSILGGTEQSMKTQWGFYRVVSKERVIQDTASQSASSSKTSPSNFQRLHLPLPVTLTGSPLRSLGRAISSRHPVLNCHPRLNSQNSH